MSEVWRAWDIRLERTVIVKFLAAGSDVDLMRRFRREALATAQLTHPGVPRIFDLDEEGGRPYLVLEKIDGITLADLSAEQGPLPIAWVVSIGAQIAAVLAAAHRSGLVHRDVKPSNVMLEPSGAVKVLDFGLAAAVSDERYSRITQTGQSLGTVGYMAPEQISAEPTDHRADLYGLGATLYQLLTGQPPFDGLTTITTARHQLRERPQRTATLRADVPADLDELVNALMAVDPAHRPASAEDVHVALAALSAPRPPIPGVVSDGLDPVRAYASAIAGHGHPTSAPPPTTTRDRPAATAADAARLLADGKPRAAARLWRQLADRDATRYGEDHPDVVEARRQVARAHLQLGQPDRALRQLESLLTRRVQALGPDDAIVHQLRQEIAALRARHATAN